MRASLWKFCKDTLAYETRYPCLLILLLFGIGAAIVFDCFIPLVFKWLFNTILHDKNVKMLWVVAGILAISFIVISIAVTLQIITAAKMGTRLINHLRFKLFKKIQTINLTKNEHTESEIINRFTDDITFVEYAAVFVIWSSFRFLLMCIIGGAVLVYFDWQMALFSAALIPLSLAIPRFFLRDSEHKLERKKQIETGLLTDVQEGITMQDVIRLLKLQVFKRKVFKEKLYDANKINTDYDISTGLTARTAFLAVTLTKLIILCIGVYLVMIDHLTIGGLIGFILLLDGVNTALIALVNSLPLLQRGAVSFNNIQQLLAEKTFHLHGDLQLAQQANHTICFNNVNFYYNTQPILSEINAAILPGQFVAFVGPSGAGKSTLLKLLLQEHIPTSGNLLLDNINVTTITSHSLLSQIGVVMQQPKLFETTIKENIRMGKLDATEAEIINAAKQAEIHQDILQMPDQYNTVVGKHNSGLSGGQTQRIAIARALIAKPSILCLDEATSALDPISGSAIENTLLKLTGTHTLLSITHRLSSAIKADQIFVLDHGRIVESGTHQQLLNNNNLYKKLWDKQQGFTFTADATYAYVDPQWLKHIPLFTTLDDLTLKNLASEFVLERFETDNIVITRGDPGEKFYILVAGTVEIIKLDKEDNEQVVAKLIDGDFFGEIALLHDTPRTATVKTVGTCIFLTLHRQQFHKIFQQLPETTQNLLLAKAKQRQA